MSSSATSPGLSTGRTPDRVVARCCAGVNPMMSRKSRVTGCARLAKPGGDGDLGKVRLRRVVRLGNRTLDSGSCDAKSAWARSWMRRSGNRGGFGTDVRTESISLSSRMSRCGFGRKPSARGVHSAVEHGGGCGATLERIQSLRMVYRWCTLSHEQHPLVQAARPFLKIGEQDDAVENRHRVVCPEHRA